MSFAKFIKNINSDTIPEYMLYERFKDNHNRTAAMTWIEYRKSNPPEYSRHDPNIFDDRRMTCGMMWRLKNFQIPTPKWMQCPNPSSLISVNGTIIKFVTSSLMKYSSSDDEYFIS